MNNYYDVKKAALTLMIVTMLTSSCVQQYPFNLGKGYILESDHNSYLSIAHSSHGVVGGQVTKFNYNSTFIVAEQKPSEIIYIQGRAKGLNKYDQHLKYFDTSTFKQYWII